MSEKDTFHYRYSMSEGTGSHLYEYFGAHARRCDDGSYIYSFACYAPQKAEVGLASDFTSWSEPANMTRIDEAGIFEFSLRTDDSLDGSKYKFYIDGEYVTDPFCIEVENGGGHASVLRDRVYRFCDDAYLDLRASVYSDSAPYCICDIRSEGYADIDRIAAKMKSLGCTHAIVSPNVALGTYTAVSRDNYITIDTLHACGVGVVFAIERITPCNDNAERAFLLSQLGFFINEMHIDGVMLPAPRNAEEEDLLFFLRDAIEKEYGDTAIFFEDEAFTQYDRYMPYTSDIRMRELAIMLLPGMKLRGLDVDSVDDMHLPIYISALGELYLSSAELWASDNLSFLVIDEEHKVVSLARPSGVGDEIVGAFNFGDLFCEVNIAVAYGGQYFMSFASHPDVCSREVYSNDGIITVTVPPHRAVVYRRCSGNFKCRI